MIFLMRMYNAFTIFCLIGFLVFFILVINGLLISFRYTDWKRRS